MQMGLPSIAVGVMAMALIRISGLKVVGVVLGVVPGTMERGKVACRVWIWGSTPSLIGRAVDGNRVTLDRGVRCLAPSDWYSYE
jgi:hypothetical protein